MSDALPLKLSRSTLLFAASKGASIFSANTDLERERPYLRGLYYISVRFRFFY
jgi:hypothetical protein